MGFWYEEEESGYKEGHIEPLIEIRETEDDIIVYADLPLVEDKKDVRVELSGDELEITATLKRTVRWERWGVYQKTQTYSQYKTRIKLPVEVDAGRARAVFQDGVLTVVLPKRKTKVKISIE